MAKQGKTLDIQFIKVSISKHALISYLPEVQSTDDWPFYLENLIHQGYKVSLVGKDIGASVGMTITDNRDGSPNRGCCFSQWAGSIGEAAQKCAILTEVYAGRAWSELAAAINQEDKEIYEQFLKFMETKRK